MKMGCYHGTRRASTKGRESQSHSSIAADSLERTDCRSEPRSCASGKRRSGYRGEKSRRGVELIYGYITRPAIWNKDKLSSWINRNAPR